MGGEVKIKALSASLPAGSGKQEVRKYSGTTDTWQEQQKRQPGS